MKGVTAFLFLLGIVMLLLELYYSNYDLIRRLHMDWPWLDTAVLSKPAWTVLNDGIWIRFLVICFTVPTLFAPVTQKPDKPLVYQMTTAIAALALFFLPVVFRFLMPSLLAQMLNIVISFVAIVVFFRTVYYFARYFSKTNAGLDENAKNSDGFRQNEELVETEVSTNLRFKYSYKNKIHAGWINLINPFRGTQVLGTPGSGKTYAVIEPFMKQSIYKGFAAVIYDFKDPALSHLVFNYRQQYIDLHRHAPGFVEPEFVYISFKDMRRTNRCNPLKGIVSSAEALDFATTLLIALNRNFGEKKGDFFVESANKFTAINIYLLGLVKRGRYQSLPHLLHMISSPPESLFPAIRLIAIFNPDMLNLFMPFESAFQEGVIEQLSGQLASAQIGLGAISDEELAFVMTEDEDDPTTVELHVNSQTQPQIVCIGNNPIKDVVYGLAGSVFLSRLAKTCNTPGRPTIFAVDEVPTVYINGIDTLIGTARSNKIAVLLGFQDFSQLERDYGDKTAKVINSTIGNLFAGAAKGETAKELSLSFGEKKVQKTSKSISHEGNISVSYSESLEKRIPQDVIEELSQGDFVGRVVDDFGMENKYKVFHGSIYVDPKEKEKPEPIPLLRDMTDAQIKIMTKRNLIKIQQEVKEILLEIGEITPYYTELREMSSKDSQRPLHLHLFLNDPCELNYLALYIWLECAYIILTRLEDLELQNNILSFDEKFKLLFYDVFQGGVDAYDTIQTYRAELDVMDLPTVRAAIRTCEDNGL